MGLKIFTSDNFDRKDRFFLARGLNFTSPDVSEYEEMSAIPYLPLQSGELSFNNNLREFDIPSSLFFFKVTDSKIVDIVKNLEIQELASSEQLLELEKKRINVFNVLTNRINAYFSNFTDKDFTLHRIYMGEPKQMTATINFDLEEPKKVGFHVDNWDKLPISKLHQAMNRICINLGKGHRYFLFINKCVQDIHSEMSKASPEYEGIMNSNHIAKLFLLEDNNYEICFVKLNPFEGYIAPTENLIHDASNFDSEYTDIQITARGYFKGFSNY